MTAKCCFQRGFLFTNWAQYSCLAATMASLIFPPHTPSELCPVLEICSLTCLSIFSLDWPSLCIKNTNMESEWKKFPIDSFWSITYGCLENPVEKNSEIKQKIMDGDRSLHITPALKFWPNLLMCPLFTNQLHAHSYKQPSNSLTSYWSWNLKKYGWFNLCPSVPSGFQTVPRSGPKMELIEKIKSVGVISLSKYCSIFY